MKQKARHPDEKLLIEGVSSNGVVFYQFKNQEEIPTIRIEAYLARNHEFTERGMRNEDLIRFCETVEDFGNEGNHMAVQQLNGYFKTLLQKPVTLYPSIYLASPLIIMGGEPIDKMDPEMDQKKMEIALSDPKVESFFLQRIIDLKPSLKDSFSSGNPLVYTANHQKMIELMFQEMISGK